MAINTKIQSMLYRQMLEHGVFMEGCILKSNIVNPGKKCPVAYSVDDIAQVGACLPACLSGRQAALRIKHTRMLYEQINLSDVT